MEKDKEHHYILAAGAVEANAVCQKKRHIAGAHNHALKFLPGPGSSSSNSSRKSSSSRSGISGQQQLPRLVWLDAGAAALLFYHYNDQCFCLFGNLSSVEAT